MSIQRNTASRLRQEDEVNRKIELMSIIQGLIPDKRGRILTEHIIVEAGSEGFAEQEIINLIIALEKDGYLKRVEDGIMMLI